MIPCNLAKIPDLLNNLPFLPNMLIYTIYMIPCNLAKIPDKGK